MARTLHFPCNAEALHAGFAETECHLRELGQDGNHELHLAAALYAEQSHRFRSDYLNLVRAHYHADVRTTDFGNQPELARREINAWVAEQTRGQIPELLKPRTVDRATVLALCEAIYFAGAWAHRFDARLTEPRAFQLDAGEAVAVPTMTQCLPLRTLELPAARLVEIPYLGERFAMTIILPRGGLEQFDPRPLPTHLAELAVAEARPLLLRLPKFTAHASLELARTLARMGMPDAFVPGRADFSGIDGTRELFIGLVAHETTIRVEEEGTEAAGASAVLQKRGPRPVEFAVDRPFLFAITERASGTVLFLGHIRDPR